MCIGPKEEDHKGERGRGDPWRRDPGEKGTGDLRKHPVAPCTKGEMREPDGKGNGGCPPDRRRVGQGNGAGREGGVGLLRAARGKESRRWASPAARGSVGGDTGG